MGTSSGGRFLHTRRQAALIVLNTPMFFAGAAWGQDSGDGTAAKDPPMPPLTGEAEITSSKNPSIGPVTHLPLPRYVSLGATRGNARRGPGLSNRIDWVFVRRGMPLKVTAEYGHWRRVEDQDGEGGWIHYSLLSGVRTVVVITNMTQFLDRPETGAAMVYKAQRNVIGRLVAATKGWARVVVDGDSGWAPKTDLWGVDPAEIFG